MRSVVDYPSSIILLAFMLQDRPWLDDDNKPAIFGSVENSRNVGTKQRKYKVRIVEEGTQIKRRGLPIGVWDGERRQLTHLLGGGKQLAMALYRALKDSPNEANVKSTLAAGYRVDMYPATLPHACRKLLMKEQSNFHDGTELTLAEVQP